MHSLKKKTFNNMTNFCNDVVKPYSTYCDKSFLDLIRSGLNFSYNDYIKDTRRELINARAKSKNSKINLANR
jgi:hypothetical protein